MEEVPPGSGNWMKVWEEWEQCPPPAKPGKMCRKKLKPEPPLRAGVPWRRA